MTYFELAKAAFIGHFLMGKNKF